MRKPIHASVFEGNMSQVDSQIEQMQAQVTDCDSRMKELWIGITTHREHGTSGDVAMQISLAVWCGTE